MPCPSTGAEHEFVWCPTAFQIVDKSEPDATLPYTDGKDGAFVAFGDLVCSGGYVLVQAHMCNRSFQKAPLALHRILEFPHMTLAKLDLGWSERSGNSTIWKTEEASERDLNVSTRLQTINDTTTTALTTFTTTALTPPPQPPQASNLEQP